MRDATLCFLLDGDEMVLALKKRGFGEGKLNGYGGKPEPGESILGCAVREVEEESGVRVSAHSLEKVAELEFYFPDVPKDKGWDQRVHAFFARGWSGAPVETDEMRPERHGVSRMPYDRMWAADAVWLKEALAGRKVVARIYFNGKGESVRDYQLGLVGSF